MGKANATPKKVFIATDWVLAIKRWSKTGIDTSNNQAGVTIYFPNNDASINAKASDGKSTLLAFKDTRNQPASADSPVIVMLKIHGGRTAYEQCPDEAYFNVNPKYDGARLMSTDDYELECKNRDIPVEVVPTALDQWTQQRN